eukprot:GAHX01003320.1.p1 GENE.GAHX01003320.1~~GAHX01003320.1.p1  ORF type:complete len:995 (-),score=161.25 GAHX01003320.1:347-3331(-)
MATTWSLGSFVGGYLIQEGLSDIIYGLKSIETREFSWASYGISKAISLVMMIIRAPFKHEKFSKITNKIAVFTKGLKLGMKIACVTMVTIVLNSGINWVLDKTLAKTYENRIMEWSYNHTYYLLENRYKENETIVNAVKIDNDHKNNNWQDYITEKGTDIVRTPDSKGKTFLQGSIKYGIVTLAQCMLEKSKSNGVGQTLVTFAVSSLIKGVFDQEFLNLDFEEFQMSFNIILNNIDFNSKNIKEKDKDDSFEYYQLTYRKERKSAKPFSFQEHNTQGLEDAVNKGIEPYNVTKSKQKLEAPLENIDGGNDEMAKQKPLSNVSNILKDISKYLSLKLSSAILSTLNESFISNIGSALSNVVGEVTKLNKATTRLYNELKITKAKKGTESAILDHQKDYAMKAKDTNRENEQSNDLQVNNIIQEALLGGQGGIYHLGPIAEAKKTSITLTDAMGNVIQKIEVPNPTGNITIMCKEKRINNQKIKEYYRIENDNTVNPGLANKSLFNAVTRNEDDSIELRSDVAQNILEKYSTMKRISTHIASIYPRDYGVNKRHSKCPDQRITLQEYKEICTNSEYTLARDAHPSSFAYYNGTPKAYFGHIEKHIHGTYPNVDPGSIVAVPHGDVCKMNLTENQKILTQNFSEKTSVKDIHDQFEINFKIEDVNGSSNTLLGVELKKHGLNTTTQIPPPSFNPDPCNNLPVPTIRRPKIPYTAYKDWEQGFNHSYLNYKSTYKGSVREFMESGHNVQIKNNGRSIAGTDKMVMYQSTQIAQTLQPGLDNIIYKMAAKLNRQTGNITHEKVPTSTTTRPPTARDYERGAKGNMTILAPQFKSKACDSNNKMMVLTTYGVENDVTHGRMEKNQNLLNENLPKVNSILKATKPSDLGKIKNDNYVGLSNHVVFNMNKQLNLETSMIINNAYKNADRVSIIGNLKVDMNSCFDNKDLTEEEINDEKMKKLEDLVRIKTALSDISDRNYQNIKEREEKRKSCGNISKKYT